MNRVAGAQAAALIDQEIQSHASGIASALAPLDAVTAVRSWLETLRAIEELINLQAEVDAQTIDRFRQTPVVSMFVDPRPIKELARHLSIIFDAGVAARFMSLCTQCCALGIAFRQHGLLQAAMGLSTVADAIGYFQSRRRHLVTLLYTIPTACGGTHQLSPQDSFMTFMPLVENSATALTGLQQKAMLAEARADFYLLVDEHGFKGSHSLQVLDALYLEPERLPITELDPRNYKGAHMLPVDPRKVLSEAEVRNCIPLLEEAYGEFNLAGTQFAVVADICRELLDHTHDDYFISVPKAAFDRIVDGSHAFRFLQRRSDFIANSNSYAPCIEVSGQVHSTVMLIERFLYYFKNICLNRIKRFQIRSGFEFEKAVKSELKARGFAISPTKRIEHQEFDVLATHRGTVFNIQCKNNFVDITRIETNRRLFVRYNRGLDRAYAAALAKEEAREHLVKQRFGGADVRYLVVSRFPIVTSNPRILSFADLQKRLSAFPGAA